MKRDPARDAWKIANFGISYGISSAKFQQIYERSRHFYSYLTKDLRIPCGEVSCKNPACYFWVNDDDIHRWCRDHILFVKKPTPDSVWKSEAELVSELMVQEVMES